MKCAVLADIHSNLTALQAVLADIAARGGVQEIWCLGDIVGYGPDPGECIAQMRTLGAICIAGNHDLAAAGSIRIDEFNTEAAAAALWTGRRLSTADRHFVMELPQKIERGPFTLAHGSPREPIWEYLLSVAEAEQSLDFFETEYCLVGHSHVPLVFECDAKGRCTMGSFGPGSPLRLVRKRLIINPGGVGQPRDHDARASYAIYDGDRATVTLCRVEYDVPAVQKRMTKAGLPARLVDRLANGV